MPTVVPTPWFAVPPLSVVLGRDGLPVNVIARPTLDVVMIERNDMAELHHVDPNAVVLVVVPDHADALAAIVATFPGTDVIGVVDR